MNRELLQKLVAAVGEKNVLTGPVDLQAYSLDAKVRGKAPLAVVRPASTSEVRQVMAACHKARCAVIPRGAGTGNVGGAVPETDAIVLETVRMNRILEISADEQLARAQAGVVNDRLDKEAGKYGLIYAPDPASHETCTLGGNAATCAGGLRAVRYGVTKNHVLGLSVVLADGRLIQTGVRTKKGVVGYDLTELFIGSEGTLGVITELTVRLMPKPETQLTLIALFDELADAGRCVVALLKSGVVPTVCELMDKKTLEAVRLVSEDAPEWDANLLLMEVTGHKEGVVADAKRIGQVCRETGAKKVHTAKDESESKKLWAARKSISPALYKLRPHKEAEDVTVPIPKLVALIEALREIAQSHGVLWAAYGHAGDGNLHANLLVDPKNEDEFLRVQKARKELFERVVEIGGTISGEHGVGSSKRDFIGLELSPDTLDVMRSIKRALDPNNILNPGKIFPPK